MVADDRIEIVLASNESYFVGLLVTAASMARHAREEVLLSFNILDGGLSECSKKELLDAVLKTHARSQICFLTLDLSQFKGLPLLAGSLMAYARLLLPRLLPEAEFALYCDVDFLWHADVTDLWLKRDRCCALQSTLETFGLTLEKERKWADAHNVKYPHGGYFCSGLCMLNLKMFRDLQLDGLVLDFLSRHQDVVFHDQSALNFALSMGDVPVGMLSRQWQVFTHEVTTDDVRGDYALHFAGNTPWAPVKVITDAEILWFRELAGIRGTSTWKALRTIHGALHILLGRVMFLLMTRMGLVRGAFVRIFTARGNHSAACLLRPLKN